jgi:hypothetical protein
MSTHTAYTALKEADERFPDEIVGVSPDDHGVSTALLFEQADVLRDEYSLDAEIAWSEGGHGTVLYFEPWATGSSNEPP